MQTAVRPRRPTQPAPKPTDPFSVVAGFSLRAVLIVVVMVVASMLVALLLLPAGAGVGKVFDFAEERLLTETSEDDVLFPRFPERSSIYASDGSLLATIFLGENRKYVKVANVSDVAIQAVLAIEDDRFYEHNGVDVRAIVRALLENLKAGRVTQGGSTITQQLVKLQFTTGEDTLSRKLREASMSLAVEKRYTKDQILELYLNKVYFANGVYGIGTAAEYYFGKRARALTLTEGALLAGMISRPEEWNPITHAEEADFRRDTVINTMARLGMIGEEERARAVDMPLGLKPHPGTPKAQRDPYFVQFIKSQILSVDEHPEFNVLGKTFKRRREALFQGGLKIYTTLDPRWQALAVQAMRASLSEPSDPEAALASVEVKTGAIRTLVSGTDFERDEFELAAGDGRQTGSAAKPFTLVAAFRQGFPAGKVYRDVSPLEIPGWRNDCGCVFNAEGGGSDDGYRDLWSATALSVNVVFAQLALDVGAENIVRAARDMGITTHLDAVPSITLGSEEATPLDMANAYATLGNEGVHCDPYAIQKIENRQGPVWRHRAKPSCEQKVAPEIANQVTAMLERVMCCGTAANDSLGGLRPHAGKTGTSPDNVNAWFVGYTRYISTAVWVGHVRGLIPMDHDYHGGPVFGSTFPADIWDDYMTQIADEFPYEDFPPPPPPEYGTVPDVIGLLEEPAMETLAEANFTPIVEVKRGAEPEGTVIEQQPGGGARLELGSGVTIFVSDGKGPPKKKVPNVIGLPQADARDAIQAAGFKVDSEKVPVVDPSLDGLVVEQSPPGGKKALEGSTVYIAIGKFEEPAPTDPPPEETDPSVPWGGAGPHGLMVGLVGSGLLAAGLRRRGRVSRRRAGPGPSLARSGRRPGP